MHLPLFHHPHEDNAEEPRVRRAQLNKVVNKRRDVMLDLRQQLRGDESSIHRELAVDAFLTIVVHQIKKMLPSPGTDRGFPNITLTQKKHTCSWINNKNDFIKLSTAHVSVLERLDITFEQQASLRGQSRKTYDEVAPG